jgi:hypothetical protein
MKGARLLAALAVVGLVFGTVYGAEKDAKPEVKALAGKVVKVDGVKVVVKAGDKDVTVTTDKDTKVTVDGKDAKVGDLKADMSVTVTPAEGVALKIEAKKAAAAGGG